MMTTTAVPTYAQQVIFSRDGRRPENFPADREAVTKIVIGSLDRNKPSEYLETENWIDWQNLDDKFPNLTHLHLWQINGLTAIPCLPAGIERLDIRRCAELRNIVRFDIGKLDALVLEDLKELRELSFCGDGGELRDLALINCPKLHPRAILDWIEAATEKLTHLDVSGAKQLSAIGKWPAGLVDFRCNGCDKLAALPARNGEKYWPTQLRRLEMRGTALPELGAFPATLDYIDLGGMTSLTALPEWQVFPRTLLLHGSGILMPPASEHGETADENVAAQTRKYFDDREQVGDGQVKRCKIMVLGNGAAGKTCLSLRLTGGRPERTLPDYNGEDGRILSTHGVQFHTMREHIQIGSDSEPVDVHVWDFGGQEIYHNTHRLFLSTGTIFLLLWNPDQDGNDSPDPNDKWRPLSYWLDYIEMACRPAKPKIAIVCARTCEATGDLREQLQKHTGRHYATTRHFFIDSIKGTGDLNELKDWIAENGGEVIKSQGTCVPSYWQIAQEMVEGWVKKMEQAEELKRENDPFTGEHKQMMFHEFGGKLWQAINVAMQQRPNEFTKLCATSLATPGWLTPDHIHRALRFLDNISWVYWKPTLGVNRDEHVEMSRVIIGQKWALEGIYTLLKRVDSNPDSEVYEKLKQNEGRFTLNDLKQWGWDALNLTGDEQRLLLSFLRDNGLCFHLDHRERDWWREDAREYLCLSHLEDAPFKAWQRRLKGFPGEDASDAIHLEQAFHRGHWDQLLSAFGEKFGRHGDYARDAFFVTNDKHQASLVSADFDPDYLKGSITVDSRGPEIGEFHSSIFAFIEESINALTSGRAVTVDSTENQSFGPGQEEIEVFISYKRATAGQPDFHAPVLRLYEKLKQVDGIKPLLDEAEIPDGRMFTDFMSEIGKAKYAVVIYSDAYADSIYCMWEFWHLMRSYMRRTENYLDNLILIQQEEDCLFKSVGGIQQICEQWRAKDEFDMKVKLGSGTTVFNTMADLREVVIPFLKHDINDLITTQKLFHEMANCSEEEMLQWILRKLQVEESEL